MTYRRPFVTDRFIAYAADARQSRVSMVIRLVDEFLLEASQGDPSRRVRPLGRLRIRIREGNPSAFQPIRLENSLQSPVLNESGFYCFSDLKDGDYTLEVSPDPIVGDWYETLQLKAVIQGGRLKETSIAGLVQPVPNSQREPLVELLLKPRPSSYPFPPTATLLRGIVKIGDPSAWDETTPSLAGAKVSGTYLQLNQPQAKNLETLTSTVGEFTVCFHRPEVGTQEVALKVEKGGKSKVEKILLKSTKRKKNENPPNPSLLLLVEGSSVVLKVGFPP